MYDWRPIDTFRDYGKKALFADSEGFILVGKAVKGPDGEMRFWDFDEIYDAIEWWMPLPPLPDDSINSDLENKPSRRFGFFKSGTTRHPQKRRIAQGKTEVDLWKKIREGDEG